MKKILVFIITILLTLPIAISSIKMSKETKKALNFIRNYQKLDFLSDKIQNKINYKDEFIDLEINDILSLKKTVKIYQWVETKKLLNKMGSYVYNYEKKWVNNFIDSRKFNDKTKNNYQKNATVYKSKLISSNNILTKKDNYELNKKYFENKIELDKFRFHGNKNAFDGAPMRRLYDVKYQNGENFTDLDLFIAAKEKKAFEEDRDKFHLINNYILFNGKNYDNPEIGDIKIIYEIFAPDYISFLGKIKDKKLVPYDNFIMVSFEKEDKKTMMKKYGIHFLVDVMTYTAILYFTLYFIVINMRNELKSISLNMIPYFNEYFIFGKKNQIVLLLTIIILLVTLKLYIILPVPIIILYVKRQIDYYSI